MISPTQNQRVNGPVTFQVNASDAYGVKQVQFLVDGVPVGAPLTAPDSGQQYLYSMTYDTTQLAAGMHTVRAAVTDNAGNTTTAARGLDPDGADPDAGRDDHASARLDVRARDTFP